MMRKFLASLTLAALMGAPVVATADDTDIYVDNDASVPPSSEPLVMFSLDYRANLTASADADVVGRYFCGVGLSSYVNQLSAINGGGSIASTTTTDSSGNTVTDPCGNTSALRLVFFDTMILTLRYVLEDIHGIKIGFMFNHNDAGTATGSVVARKCKGANLVNADCDTPGLTADNKDCDGDGVQNQFDYCPTIEDSTNANSDGDNCGSACDNCPGVPNDYTVDSNADGIADSPPFASTQLDSDGDGLGDACDTNPDAGGSSGAGLTPTNSNGGVILMGFQSIDNGVALTTFLNKLIALKKLKPSSNSPDHPYQGTELFYEFYRYLTGQGIYNGHNGLFDFESGATKDNTTNMACNPPNTDATTNPACWDSAIESGANYTSPLLGADACAKIFTVNFMFQVSQQENDPSVFTTPRASGGLGIPAPSTQNDFFPAVLNFLKSTDLSPTLDGNQTVTSFFLVNPSQINNTTTAYSVNGGTTEPLPLAENPSELVATLKNVFEQILSVSTTLVAASVPVNVFNRSEIVDNVYFALFQAQNGGVDDITPQGRTFWPGNLKKLKLEPRDVTDTAGNVIGRRIVIVDALSQPAINVADGRIRKEAMTLWSQGGTPLMDEGDTNGDGEIDATDGPDTDTIADNRKPPAAASGDPANQVDVATSRDGRFVARGAAGQQIPGFIDDDALTGSLPGDASPALTTDVDANGPRKVFYLSKTSSTAALASLDVSLASNAEIKAQLGNASMTDTVAEDYIRYARGQDVKDEDGDNDETEARYWLLGDPLHSRPLPLNYGKIKGHESALKPAIFIAMAANDGALHMFRNTTAGGAVSSAELGQEVWAFYPPEGLAVQAQLADNNVQGNQPEHPYSFDGEPTALVVDQDGDGNIECSVQVPTGSYITSQGTCDGSATQDRVILYIGLRRGGSGTNSASITSAYYAIDVTDPMVPRFLWRITPTTRTLATTFGASVAGEKATGDFMEMGFTFSRPRVGSVTVGTDSAGAAIKRLAVFFGGGYNGGYTGALDSDNRPVRFGKDIDGSAGMQNDDRGNALFVVRANNAELIWKAVGPRSDGTTYTTATDDAKVFRHAGLRDSIASNLALMDSDADGSVDRVYVGDLGGNVWRADLGPHALGSTAGTAPAVSQAETTDDWKLTRVACLGRHGGAGCSDLASRLSDRRFFHEPDVVQGRDESGRYDAIVIGSGDRENPLDQGVMITVTNADGTTRRVLQRSDVDNFLFMIKDRNVGLGQGCDDNLASQPGFSGVTCTVKNYRAVDPASATAPDVGLLDVTSQCLPNTACGSLLNGWRLSLNTPDGEKSLSAPVTIANTVFFTTYLPPPPPAAPGTPGFTCGPKEGGGFLYAISLSNAAPRYNYDTSNGGSQTDSGTTASDRRADLQTPGIPAQVVYLGAVSGNTGSSGCTVNILAGARIFEAPGCPRFRTFWQRVGS
jgi:type IV pilus assembly protein PilY1